MNLATLLRALRLDQAFFTLAYWRKRVPWDTGVTPPELVRVVEGQGADHIAPGRALDLGCGTGTNSLYLARHGWTVTGVDFARPAIAHARAKAAAAGDDIASRVRFLQGDVTHLEALHLSGPFDLVLDMGCFHGVSPEGRGRYAAQVARLTRAGTLLLLYAVGPTQMGPRVVGVDERDVVATFGRDWTLARTEGGKNPDGRVSAWYWLRRM